MKSIDVLILSTVEGHLSIATTVADALRGDGLSCHVAVCPDRILRVYRFFSRYRPSLLKIFVDLLEVPLFRRAVSLRLRAGYTRILFELLHRHSPRLLVNTNYAFEPSITRHRGRIRVPYLNIMTDPRTYFLINASTVAEVNCVFDDRQAQSIRRRHPRARTMVIGWLVRRQFQESADRGPVRRALGLEPDLFTVFVAAGWEGTNQVLKILPGLITVRRPVQVVVACGNNTRMLGLVESIAATVRERAAHVRITALPFTREIHRHMQAADLVVGKAGPNMLFESVATGAPFFAITHNHGQEDGNLDIIREYRIGLVEENPRRARARLQAIVDGRESLDGYRAGVRDLARSNRDAVRRVRDAVRGMLDGSARKDLQSQGRFL
jgi:UDP-N-acetylglucosamine:LPS N-acetylglucosamine transferase